MHQVPPIPPVGIRHVNAFNLTSMVWPSDVLDEMQAADKKARMRHGYYETLMAVGAAAIRGMARHNKVGIIQQPKKENTMEENCTFSEALEAIKNGCKFARRGWNGVKAGLPMFVVMMPELHLPPFNNQEPGPKVNDRTAKHIGNETPLDSQPYFALFTGVEGANWQPGWTPSTMDLVAEDWYQVAAGE